MSSKERVRARSVRPDTAKKQNEKSPVDTLPGFVPRFLRYAAQTSRPDDKSNSNIKESKEGSGVSLLPTPAPDANEPQELGALMQQTGVDLTELGFGNSSPFSFIARVREPKEGSQEDEQTAKAEKAGSKIRMFPSPPNLFANGIAQFKLIPQDLPPGEFNEREQTEAPVAAPELENHDFEAAPPPQAPSESPADAGEKVLSRADAEMSSAQSEDAGNDKSPTNVQMPDPSRGKATPNPESKAPEKKQPRTPANGIPASIASRMQAVFNMDVSAVKVVQNSSAAREAGALAFAAGDTLHFAPGQFNPNSPQGQQLIGHELAHIVQQQQGRVKATGEMNGMALNTDRALEAEADNMARSLLNAPVPEAEEGSESASAGSLRSTAAPVSQLQDDGSNLYGTYQELLNWAAEQKSKIQADTTTLKDSVTQLGDGQKESISQLVETQVQRMRDAIQAAQEHIRTTTSNARTAITTHREAKVNEVNTTADAEIEGITQLVADKKQQLVDRGETHATGVVTHAETEANRAINESASNSTQVNQIITSTAANYSDRDGIQDAVTSAQSNAGDLTTEFTSLGNTMATEVREDANGMAADIRQEALDAGAQFDQPLADATEMINRKRDETVTALQGSGDNLLTTLETETEESISALDAQITEQEATLRSFADGTDETVDQAVSDAHTLIEEQMQNSADDLDRFVQDLEEIGWYSTEIEAAKNDLDTALQAHRADIDAKITEVSSSFDAHKGEVQTGSDELTSAIETTLTEVCTAFDDEVNPKIDEIKGEMDTMTTEACDEIKTVKPAMEPELDGAVTDTEDKWIENRESAESDISTKVDTGLERQQATLTDFSSQINDEFDSLPSRDRGFWESVWEGIKDVGAFIGGVFVGIFMGLVDMVRGIIDIIITPAKWLMAAVVIIGAILLIAVVAFFAGISFGLAALIVGAIAGIGFMLYYFYQAATAEGLSPYERGQLVGRGIFEGIMAFAGTGVWARLGSWSSRIGQISALVNRVGGLSRFLRMAVWVDDVERLMNLINRVDNIGELAVLFGRLDNAGDAARLLDIVEHMGDAGRIATFFGNGGNVAAILSKVDDVGKFVQIMDRVNDAAELTNILRVGNFRNISDLHTLLELTSVRDLDTLSRLIENAGSVEELISMANRLKSLTFQEAENAVNTLSNAERGPVQSGILDTMFPEAGPFFGRNDGIPADLYPLLRERLAEYLPIRAENLRNLTDQDLQRLIAAGIPGDHSEINALSRALWNRHNALGLGDQFLSESALAEFLLNNVALRGGRKLIGAPPRCPNCNFLTDGVTLVSIDELAAFQRMFEAAGAAAGPQLQELAQPNVYLAVVKILGFIFSADNQTPPQNGN